MRFVYSMQVFHWFLFFSSWYCYLKLKMDVEESNKNVIASSGVTDIINELF